MTAHDPRPPTSAEGRDAQGRFAKGNPGGPGNPFARKSAALRQALVDAVSEDDIRDIAIVLLLLARRGDLAAAKLLFSYVIGKPQPAVDPDTLDQHEWQTWLTRLLPIGDLGALIGKWPVETLCGLLPGLLLARDADCRATVLAGLEGLDTPAPSPGPEPQQAPSTNRENGPPAPMTNGPNGAGAKPGPAAAPRPEAFDAWRQMVQRIIERGRIETAEDVERTDANGGNGSEPRGGSAGNAPAAFGGAPPCRVNDRAPG
jgi:hypothetical protein